MLTSIIHTGDQAYILQQHVRFQLVPIGENNLLEHQPMAVSNHTK